MLSPETINDLTQTTINLLEQKADLTAHRFFYRATHQSIENWLLLLKYEHRDALAKTCVLFAIFSYTKHAELCDIARMNKAEIRNYIISSLNHDRFKCAQIDFILNKIVNKINTNKSFEGDIHGLNEVIQATALAYLLPRVIAVLERHKEYPLVARYQALLQPLHYDELGNAFVLFALLTDQNIHCHKEISAAMLFQNKEEAATLLAQKIQSTTRVCLDRSPRTKEIQKRCHEGILTADELLVTYLTKVHHRLIIG